MNTEPLTKSQIFAVLWMVLIGFYLFTGPRNFTVSTEISFLLVGATALALVTPVIGALLRWRRPAPVEPKANAQDA